MTPSGRMNCFNQDRPSSWLTNQTSAVSAATRYWIGITDTLSRRRG